MSRPRRTAVLKPRVYKAADEYAAVGVPADVNVAGAARLERLAREHRASRQRAADRAARRGRAVGELTLTDGTGEVLARAPLVSLAAVPQGGLWTRIVDSVELWFRKK